MSSLRSLVGGGVFRRRLPFVDRVVLLLACTLLACTLLDCTLDQAFGQQQDAVVLKNGLILKGSVNYISSLDESKHSKSVEIKSKPLLVIDDGLRQTHFHNQLAANSREIPPLFSITLNNLKRKTAEGPVLTGIVGSDGTEFNEFGRRVCQVRTASNKYFELLQGITEVTPNFIRVETMKMEKPAQWDMRISIDSINRKRLKQILLSNANTRSEKDWLDIVSLFNQAGMYPEAIDVLEEAMKRLPEMEVHRNKLAIFTQAIADQMLDEVELRRNAGQYDLANALLRGFRPEGLAAETQLKIQKRLQDDLAESERYKRIVTQLREQVAKLEDLEIKSKFSPVVEEIAKNLSQNTIDRMVDYDRLKDDEGTPIDNRVAVGIGGWILGPGLPVESLSLARALIETRELVGKYLGSKSEVQRRDYLQQIKKMESNAPRFVAPLVAKMLPALPLPKPVDYDPTRYLVELPIPQLDGEQGSYYLQLPPQYDPYRSYPCILAIGAGDTNEAELNWWSGRYSEDFQMASGQASRHGYIVVAPKWKNSGQSGYQSTENEHARALACLRDAMRRTSVDANRVFVGGHYGGAMLAWDLSLSHPDLWAGSVCIGLSAPTDYIKHYHESVRYVPMYFVSGQLDGVPGPLNRFGAALDEYVQSSRNDVIYVQYNGRGRDYFVEELSRIMDWMDLPGHRRVPPPEKDIFVRSARPGDNYYWWLEVTEFNPDKMNHPLKDFSPKRVADIKFDRNPINNSFSFESLPAKKFTLWLEPGNVDFSKKVKLRLLKKDQSTEVTPSVDVLLEDVRTRADRQRPFWAKID